MCSGSIWEARTKPLGASSAPSFSASMSSSSDAATSVDLPEPSQGHSSRSCVWQPVLGWMVKISYNWKFSQWRDQSQAHRLSKSCRTHVFAREWVRFRCRWALQIQSATFRALSKLTYWTHQRCSHEIQHSRMTTCLGLKLTITQTKFRDLTLVDFF